MAGWWSRSGAGIPRSINKSVVFDDDILIDSACNSMLCCEANAFRYIESRREACAGSERFALQMVSSSCSTSCRDEDIRAAELYRACSAICRSVSGVHWIIFNSVQTGIRGPCVVWHSVCVGVDIKWHGACFEHDALCKFGWEMYSHMIVQNYFAQSFCTPWTWIGLVAVIFYQWQTSKRLWSVVLRT